MRRFASVFLSKHSDHSDNNRSHTLNIVPPILSPTSDHRSSGSSTASSLRTPEDVPTRTISKKSWISWLGVNRSSSKSSKHSGPPTPHPPVLHQTEDESSDDSDDESVSSPESTPTFPPVTLPHSDSSKSIPIATSNCIVPSLSPSPFHHLTGTLFPRSCNHPRSLHPPQTMLSTMLKSHLSRRLQSGITPPEGLSLISFQSSTPSFDEPAVSDPLQLTPVSYGLRRWISRPCFEDRFVVWLHVPGSDDVICHRVTGSSLGVAELEFSDAIDAMAGYTGDYVESLLQSQLPQLVLVPEEGPDPPSESSNSSHVPTLARNTPYKALPSPLRMQYGPPSTPSSPVSISTTKLSFSQEPVIAPLISSQKRGVRFVEDDKEDHIPLGYVLRIKKKREEKARFLKEQQERRAFQEERAKVQQERLQRDAERAEWEKERKAWEKEKRTMEEEKKAKLYAGEVAAARLRRESQRTGMAMPSTSTSPPPMREMESSFKQDPRRYSRPLYDSQHPRRLASEPNVQTSITKDSSPHSGSPSSSRPPSIAGHSPTSGSQSSSIAPYSRPPSTYSAHTSSMEDVRGVGTSKKGKRASMASMASLSSSKPGGPDRASSYPGYGFIPPVPPVPVYAIDMPLLPPTPPFMMHQYPRSRSHHSGSPESSASSSPVQRTPGNHISDHGHQIPSPSSSSSPRKPAHHRHSSGDTRPSGSWSRSRKDSQDQKQQRPQPTHSHSQTSSYSRGRQSQSLRLPSQAQLHPPSPWTALPTTSQLHERTLSNSTRGGPQPNRRQSVVS